MKFKRRQFQAEQVRAEDVKVSGDEQVRRALHSYPERFAREPDVTFEEHRSSLQMLIQSAARRCAQRQSA